MHKNKSNCSLNYEYKYSTIPDDRAIILRLPILVSYTMSNIYYYRVHGYFITIAYDTITITWYFTKVLGGET